MEKIEKMSKNTNNVGFSATRTRYRSFERDACYRRALDLIVAELGAEEMESIWADDGDPSPYQRSLGYINETVQVLRSRAAKTLEDGRGSRVPEISGLRNILDQSFAEVNTWHFVSE